MIGLEKIISRIEADGEQECGALLSDARRRADEIRAEYARTAAHVREEGEKELAAELSRMEKSRRDLMQMDCRRALLEAKQALMEETFRGAHQALSTLNDARRETLFAAIAGRAQLPDRTGELILSETDRKTVGAAVAKQLPQLCLSDQTRDIEGLILRYGPLEVDCTFETILEELRHRLSTEIAALLFDGEDDDGDA